MIKCWNLICFWLTCCQEPCSCKENIWIIKKQYFDQQGSLTWDIQRCYIVSNLFLNLLMSSRYQIGLRYTGGARMLLMLSLKFGIIPITVPVGVRDFDIDGELWVKLRLIPTEPWVGAVSWAFVSLPKIKFELSPFRLFNLMGMSTSPTWFVIILWSSLVSFVVCVQLN